MKKTLLLLLLPILFFGCTGKIKTLELSDTSLEFSASAGTQYVSVNGGLFSLTLQEGDSGEVIASQPGDDPVCRGEWLTVDFMSNDQRLVVSVTENATGLPRHGRICVYGPDSENHIDVTQTAE